MFAEFAAELILALFATTPPHFPTEGGLMCSARPVKVFLLVELLRALLALLYSRVEFAFLQR